MGGPVGMLGMNCLTELYGINDGIKPVYNNEKNIFGISKNGVKSNHMYPYHNRTDAD